MKNECLLAVTNELDALKVPYQVRSTRKHILVLFGPEFRLRHVLPATSSDRRAPLNARADIRRTIRKHIDQGSLQ